MSNPRQFKDEECLYFDDHLEEYFTRFCEGRWLAYKPEPYRVLAQLYRQQMRYDDAGRVYRDAFALYRGNDLGRGSIIDSHLWSEVIDLFMDAAELSALRGDLPGAAHGP